MQIVPDTQIVFAQVVLIMMGLLLIGGVGFITAGFYRRWKETRGRLVVGDTVKSLGEFHDMVGEVTGIEMKERFCIWVRWENDATCNYYRDELKRVVAVQPGTWIGDCGEPTCGGRHYVEKSVERHGGKRCVAFTCGTHSIRQSERRFLKTFRRVA